MPTLAGVALSKGLQTDACDRCGATDDAGRVTLSFPPGILSSGQQVVAFCLCVWCQAELLGVSTGFKTGNALRQWYRVRRLTRKPALPTRDGKPIQIEPAFLSDD